MWPPFFKLGYHLVPYDLLLHERPKAGTASLMLISCRHWSSDSLLVWRLTSRLSVKISSIVWTEDDIGCTTLKLSAQLCGVAFPLHNPRASVRYSDSSLLAKLTSGT